MVSAVERRLTALGGVVSANVQLRGTAAEPEVTAKVTIEERTDVAQVVDHVRTEMVRDLGLALDTSIAWLGLQIEVDRDRRSGTNAVVLAAPAADTSTGLARIEPTSPTAGC